MPKHLCVIFLFLVCTSIGFGRRCMNRLGKIGECKRPNSCSTVHDDIINKIYPQRCGRLRFAFRHCCVEEKIGEKSEEMCKKYEDLSFKTELAPTLLFEEEYIKIDICPFDYEATTVIYGGQEAKLGEFPHMALIGYESVQPKWKCGGSLISNKFVLSAAHCLYHREYGNPIMVRLGDVNFTNTMDDMYIQEIPIKKSYSHPKYKYPSTYHDIAIFELEFPANLSIYVKPICISTTKDMPYGQVLAVGWGDTDSVEKGENDMLMKVALDVFDYRVCARIYSRGGRAFPIGFDFRSQICAGSTSMPKDTCQGDSGGPIQIKNKDVVCSYYLVGVTSHGKGCGIKLPSVYTKVYPYIKWIEDIIYSTGE